MTYSLYGLVDEHERSKPLNMKEKCLMAYLITAPPLITKEQVKKFLKEREDKDNDG